MSLGKRWILGLLLPLLLAQDLSAQGISGRVLDGETDQGVGSAAIALLDAGGSVVRSALTDSAGAFLFPVERSGRYHLRAERIGYASVTSPAVDMRAGDTLVVELRIAAEAVLLAPLTVTASSRPTLRERALDDFYDRSRRGWGTFFTPGDIERLRPWSIVNLLQLTPGVDIRYGRGTESRVRMRSTRGECTPAVYVDGARVPAGNVGIEAFVSGSSIRAVEIYRRPQQVPGEFASGQGDCGVIVIWTSLRLGW